MSFVRTVSQAQIRALVYMPQEDTMLEKLKNSGMFLLKNSSPPPHLTVIVVGVARSGTSMAASVLNQLGLFMGDRADLAVFEDTRIAEALERNAEDLAAVIAGYNARFPKWGFKRPMAFQKIDQHLHLFRSPRIVVMFRDPAAIAKRNEVSMGINVEAQLVAASRTTFELSKFVAHTKAPTLVVSYEKALFDPAGFVGALSQFAGLDVPISSQEAAVRAIRNGPEIYLTSSQVLYARD